MPNPIKYSVTPETLALKKGNFWIGTGDVDKGPTSTTGFWNGITPASGGYVIYQNKPSEGPSIYSAVNDAELIQYTFLISGQSFAAGPSALDWYNSQSDKMVFNIDYPPFVTNGLILHLDAGFTPSFSRTGASWYDLGPNGSIGSLKNTPGFDPANNGSLVFDGSDDYVDMGSLSIINGISSFSFSIAFNSTQDKSYVGLFGEGYGPSYTLELHNGFLRWWVGGNTKDTIGKYNDGKWYICTITQTSNIYKCYINGNLVLDTTQTPLTLGTGNFAIASWNNISYTYAGKISLFQIYNKVLSANEVLQNYQSILPRFLSQNIVTSGLTVYLDAGYSQSYPGTGTSWFNVAGTPGATGTLNNGATYSSSNGGCIVLDGTDDTVTGTFAWNRNNFTFMWFMYPTATVNYNPVFGAAKNNGTGFWGDFTWHTTSTGGIYTGTDVSSRITPSTPGCGSGAVPANTWQSWACTFSSNNNGTNGAFRLYKNGQFLASVTSNLPVTPSGAESYSMGLNMKVATYFAYNRALTASEILQNFNAQKSRFGL